MVEEERRLLGGEKMVGEERRLLGGEKMVGRREDGWEERR